MNTVDLTIIIACLAIIGRSFQVGLLRQVASTGGFFTGLWLGSMIAPHITGTVQGDTSRALLALIITLGLGAAVGGAAEAGSIHLRNRIKHPPLQKLESWFGALFGVGAVLIASWLITAMLFRLPLADVNLQIERSKIISYLNAKLPPAPSVISRVGNLISPNGFPKVFIESEPQLRPTGPADAATVQRAAAIASASTVKIEGLGCGGLAVGSGFITGPNLVATNAHVIAGVQSPLVVYKGARLRATPVWFNPGSDFAVLRVNAVLGPILPLAEVSVSPGTSAAILGYPGGGGLTISPTVVLGERVAIGRDIYNHGVVARKIYEVVADVRPGNSGGPMVLKDGTVAGVVFASSVSNEGYGYVLTAGEVRNQLANAKANSPVGTGACTD